MSRCFLLSSTLAVLLAACGQPATPVAQTTKLPSPTLTQTLEVGVAFATRVPATVALLQTTPTTTPTPTITPTPTPIVYTIQPGDTIWTIAATSNREVDEIMALNPTIRPEALQVGSTMILPPAPTPLFNVGRTPQPISVEILRLDRYRASANGVWLLGIARNQGATPIADLQLRVELLAADNQPLAGSLVWSAIPVLLPGETAPFGLLLPAQPEQIKDATASVVSVQPLADLGTHYLDLNVSQQEMVSQDGRLQLRGQVVNEGDSVATDISLVATLFDDKGSMSGYVIYQLPDELQPQTSRRFVVDASPPGAPPVRVKWSAQGRLAVP